MSILILNRLSDEPYLKWLEGYEGEVIFLTDSKVADHFNSEDYTHFESFDHYLTGEVDIRAIELYEEYKYDVIIAVSEYDIIRAAKLREYFGLEGQDSNSAIQFRNKVKMKEILSSSGVNVTPFKQILTTVDIVEFIQQHGYPVVIKPLDEMGSIGIHKIKNYNQLSEFLQNRSVSNLMIEKYVSGSLYGVDGLVVDGEIKLIQPSKFRSEGFLFDKDPEMFGEYQLHSSNPLHDRLVNAAASVLKSLSTPKLAVFHCEIFHTYEDDQIIINEIASRSGGEVDTFFEVGYGIFPTKEWVQAQIKKDYIAPTRSVHRLSAFIKVPPKNGTLLSIPSNNPFPWIVRYDLLAEVGQRFEEETRHYTDGVVRICLIGETEEEVKARMEEAYHWFEASCKWDLSSKAEKIHSN